MRLFLDILGCNLSHLKENDSIDRVVICAPMDHIIYSEYYERIAQQNNPELEFKYKKPFTKDQSFVDIKPEIFSQNITIIHKGYRGFVDLQISKINIDEFRKLMKNKLREGMTINNTGKSFSVRILVSKLPKISSMAKFEMYGEQITEALNAASQLMKWYVDFKNEPIFR